MFALVVGLALAIGPDLLSRMETGGWLPQPGQIQGAVVSATPTALAVLPDTTTPTATRTPSPTGTPTVPATATRTSTGTAMATTTASATPTQTSTPAPTATSTPLPTPTVTNTPAPPHYIIHKVRSGETLKTIAALYDTTPEIIIAFNGLANPNLLQEGQEIAIPQ